MTTLMPDPEDAVPITVSKSNYPDKDVFLEITESDEYYHGIHLTNREALDLRDLLVAHYEGEGP